jgi:prefoldin subunit 5
MTGRTVLALKIFSMCILAPPLLYSSAAHPQDVPGTEICTVEKTMERRTSCLQSNIDFLQKSIAKLAADHQQKIDAARAQVESLKATLISLQKIVDDLKAARNKVAEDPKTKTDTPAPKEGPPPAKQGEKK